MKNENNYVLEAFDYNFIIMISQRISNGRDKLKYAMPYIMIDEISTFRNYICMMHNNNM